VFCAVISISSVATDGLSADQKVSGKTEAAMKALERGRTFKQRGQFKQAWEQFEIARQIAPESSRYRQQAEQELNYYLPLKEVQYLVNVGDLDGAERLLNELWVINQATPTRLTELNTMLQNLKVMR
jgi:tetratricopeptide (TPR) repeat protein